MESRNIHPPGYTRIINMSTNTSGKDEIQFIVDSKIPSQWVIIAKMEGIKRMDQRIRVILCDFRIKANMQIPHIV